MGLKSNPELPVREECRGEGYTGVPGQKRLVGARYCTGVGQVVAQIVTMVDTGEDNVDLLLHQCVEAQHHAIDGSARDSPRFDTRMDIVLNPGSPQRLVHGEGVPFGALGRRGRDDRNGVIRRDCRDESLDPLRPQPVVIGDKDVHVSLLRPRTLCGSVLACC